MWAWGAAGAVGVGGFIWWRKRTSAQSAPSQGASAATSADSSTIGDLSGGSAVPIVIPANTESNTGLPDWQSAMGQPPWTGAGPQGQVTPPATATGSTVGGGVLTTSSTGPAPSAGPSYPQFVTQGGSYYVVAWDYYGPGKGVGANEVAAFASIQGKGVISPSTVTAWNGGKAFYSAGTNVYVGNAGWSGKPPAGGFGVGK